ncbi:carboxypeptidase G2 [Legionella lansingensis]|uniref:Carboxypeptidase G2 n=1 Tax=Legionella lansingensis TaxID=45067 RepID=A0A0W0VGM0_9GAMM|nr:hydrolase [Legionella lansingensis]KTD19272.1 carboxypeptidase G2 [Legionella lansingensis]SNV50543.1 carboxypeptidase G2 [Legionella lansingensis]
MDQVRKDLLPYLDARKPSMVEQLHRFCEINSGTENLQGLAIMLKTLKTAFTPLADQIHTRQFPAITTMNMVGEASIQQCGDALFIRKRPELKRRVLLAGHMDTVYGANHPFQKLMYVNENTINGPGVTDMKGGLIVILHALSVFEESPLASTLGWDVVINADEETGSLVSSALYDEIARDYQAALVYEPAADAEGAFAKNRSGSAKLTLVATGKTAHAGRSFYEGRNAICYLAEAITAIHALNGLKEGVTINVGKIAGGTALNVVPDKAVAKMDVRISQTEDEFWVRDQIHNIIHKLERPGYSLSLHGSFHRPVKKICPATERLFSRIQAIGRQLGLNLDWRNTGGCCDGNNLAQHGLAVIDTLGVRGGRVHSSEEFILLNSLVERTALSALLLFDLAQGGLEELQK